MRSTQGAARAVALFALSGAGLVVACTSSSREPAVAETVSPPPRSDAGEQPPGAQEAADAAVAQPAQDPEIARLVATLDDDADHLHADITPSVLALSRRGADGALAVLPALDASGDLTRLRAQRVVEAIAATYNGWSRGQGYVDGALGEERVRALLRENGSYDWRAPRDQRQRSIELWRRWLEAHRTPPDVTRVRGDVEGSFELERSHVAAGQPIWVRLTFTNRGAGAIRFNTGGDSEGSLWLARYRTVVTDGAGVRLCDSRDIVNLGGLGQVETIEAGAEYTERLLLNPVCDALLRPGSYRVVMTRTLALDERLPEGCDALSVPDLTEAGTPPPGMSQGCFDALRAVPQLTTETTLVVSSFDRARLVASQESEVAELGGGVAPGYRVWYFQWACRRLRCDCPPADLDSVAGTIRWMRAAIAGMPATVPAQGCRPAPPSRAP